MAKQMTKNSHKRYAIASFLVAAVFSVLIFIPETVGIDGFDGGFAISLVSLFVTVTGALAGLMFLGSASKLDLLLRGEGVLAHWVYNPDFWAEFTCKEYLQEKSEKKGLFLIVSAFALFFGFLFWILDSEAGFWVFIVMLGVTGLCFAAWQLSSYSNQRNNTAGGVKEVYISKEAIYLNNKFYTWKAPLTHFRSVTQEINRGVPVLVFRYTVYSRTGPQTYTTRLPVPPGQEQTAQRVIEQVNK